LLPVSSFFIITAKRYACPMAVLLCCGDNAFKLCSYQTHDLFGLYTRSFFYAILLHCLPGRKRSKKKGQPITRSTFSGMPCAARLSEMAAKILWGYEAVTLTLFELVFYKH